MGSPISGLLAELVLQELESTTFPKRESERMLGSPIHEHKLAVRRGDAFSQVAAHTYETGHEFKFAAAKVIVHTGSKTSRGLIEARASVENSANRSIDLAPAYITLRRHLRTADTFD
ncbi:unnamed protein product [Dibothriocephalus latus]|uniref:Uncharacterized protein n=1 Tax=Dibothriocephalus latus TaxID=60516 RepID=A0A3P7P9P3_DIBLA|nr:unnamed protein product [Dibothriocephalus latus]